MGGGGGGGGVGKVEGVSSGVGTIVHVGTAVRETQDFGILRPASGRGKKRGAHTNNKKGKHRLRGLPRPWQSLRENG